MKAKLLPAMIGVVLAGGMAAAQADVQVFGHLDQSLLSVDEEASSGGSSTSEDDLNLKCTTCSIGFKGSEDLGNGLKAIFKLDFQFDMNNRNRGAITDRDQWLGMKGNFGQVRIGTISTGYKSHGAKIDPLYRTAFQGRDHGLQSSLHSGAGEELHGRAEHTIRYDSPSFNGFKVVAHYTLDSDEGDGEDEDPFGIGASYNNGGLLVFADYMDNNQGSSDPDGEFTAWKIGGKFGMDQFAVMGQYEEAEETFGSSTIDLEVWHIAGSFTMGNNMIYLGYGQGEESGSGFSDDYDAFTIAGTHKLSKRTMAYAGYNNFDADSTSGSGTSASTSNFEVDTFGVGLKHKF